MVVLFDLRFAVGDPTSHIPDLARTLPDAVSFGIATYGHLGVAVLFVISGFIAAHSIAGYRQSGRFFLRFSARRLVQVTPAYYGAIGAAIGVAVLRSVVNRQGVELEGKPFTAGRLIANLAYAPDSPNQSEITSALAVVCVDMACCLVLAGLNSLAYTITRLTGRNGYCMVFVPVGVVALVLVLGPIAHNLRPFSWVGLPATFLLGAAVCNASLDRIRWRTALGFVALYGAGAAIGDAPFKVVAVATALVIGLAAYGNGVDRWLQRRLFELLGRVSLSLYLTHSFVFSSCSFVVAEFLGTGLSAQVVFVVVALAASLLVAWMTWAFAERPAERWALRISLGRRGHFRSIEPWPELSVADRVAMLVDR
jgi:peptidoglycan/LPS O-acetylase OafA/YrhL